MLVSFYASFVFSDVATAAMALVYGRSCGTTASSAVLRLSVTLCDRCGKLHKVASTAALKTLIGRAWVVEIVRAVSYAT